MKHIPGYLLLLLLAASFATCTEKQPVTHTQPATQVKKDSVLSPAARHKNDLLAASISAYNCQLITDSLMPAYRRLVKYYFKKYRADTCMGDSLHPANFKYNEGVQPLGRIRLNKPSVSVFVWSPLNFCDVDGESYYFTDTTLPRLPTDSYCCHPNSLFTVGDIDEDGICEIGQYLSTCVSRHKQLIVYSLKNNVWERVGDCSVDVMASGDVKSYKPFVRKTGRGKFEMLEMERIKPEDKPEKDWLKFSF